MVIVYLYLFYVVYSHISTTGEEIVQNFITYRNVPDTLRSLFLLMVKIAIRATTTTIENHNNNDSKVDV